VFRFLLTQPGGLDPAYYEDAYQWQLMDQIFDGPPDRDLAEAQRLLVAAGHPGGKGLPFVDFWANHGNPAMKAASAVIARNPGEIGIRVRERSAPRGRVPACRGHQDGAALHAHLGRRHARPR
jgi:hypothetical protein